MSLVVPDDANPEEIAAIVQTAMKDSLGVDDITVTSATSRDLEEEAQLK